MANRRAELKQQEADLSARIAAIQRDLDARRAELASLEKDRSKVKNAANRPQPRVKNAQRRCKRARPGTCSRHAQGKVTMSSPNEQKWVFRLYIAGEAPNSRIAMATLEDIRQAYRLAHYELVIVDILKDPLVAIRDGILVTPTLVKLCPGPECKIVGNLSERAKVLQSLGLSGGIE